MYGTVPTLCMVQYQQYMVQYQLYVWYSTNSMYGTVPTVCMVQYQLYVWYSTNSMYGTGGKYNNVRSKTGVPQNAPVMS